QITFGCEVFAQRLRAVGTPVRHLLRPKRREQSLGVAVKPPRDDGTPGDGPLRNKAGLEVGSSIDELPPPDPRDLAGSLHGGSRSACLPGQVRRWTQHARTPMLYRRPQLRPRGDLLTEQLVHRFSVVEQVPDMHIIDRTAHRIDSRHAEELTVLEIAQPIRLWG